VVAVPLPSARGSRAETWIIGLVALLGALLALHRNGTLAAVFGGDAYGRVEASLGGPDLGTPRGVEALVAKTPVAASGAPSKKP
jgi:hypothetical protein